MSEAIRKVVHDLITQDALPLNFEERETLVVQVLDEIFGLGPLERPQPIGRGESLFLELAHAVDFLLKNAPLLAVRVALPGIAGLLLADLAGSLAKNRLLRGHRPQPRLQLGALQLHRLIGDRAILC